VAADQKRRSERKDDHPLAGRFLNAITPRVQAQPAPQHIQAWATGAPGEKKVGQTLDAIPGIIVLHDRHKPRSRSNLDHIAVTSTGVWLIDTKVRSGKRLEFRNKGGLFSRDERLIVGGRDETRLVDNMAWQVEIVSDVCGDLLGDTVVRPALCFVEATVGLFDRRAWTVRGVVICWRDLLPQLLGRPGPFNAAHIDRIARRIALQLPAA
jgi:Nuclease-related domain